MLLRLLARRMGPSVVVLTAGALGAAAQDATVSAYGQFNAIGTVVDDGEDTSSYFGDNTDSNSRLGFNINWDFGSTDLRFNFETGLGLAPSDSFNQNDSPDIVDWDRGDLRKFEFIWSGDFGKLSAGQGSMVSDGASSAGFSLVQNAGTGPIDEVGGFFFNDSDTGTLTSVTPADGVDDFEGSRRFRIRYDTPEYAGFVFGVAYGENVLSDSDDNTYYDTGVYWEGGATDLRLNGALTYEWREPESGDTRERLVTSFGAIHEPTGINGKIAYADEKDGGHYIAAQAGWQDEIIDFGPTGVALNWYEGSSIESTGSSDEMWSLVATQVWEDYNLETTVGWRLFSHDDETGTNYDDLNAFFIAARFKWSY